MKTKKHYIVIAVFAIVTLGAGVALAKRSCWSMLDNLKGIELTDAQRTKLEAKQTGHQKKMIQLRADLSVARLEKQKMMKGRNFKKEKVEKQIKKMMAVKTDMQMARLDALADLRTVFTDEQWEVFSKHMGKRGHGFGNEDGFDRGPGKQGHHRGGYKGKHGRGDGYPGNNRAKCPYYDHNSQVEE